MAAELLSAHTERNDTTVKAQVGGNGFNGPSTLRSRWKAIAWRA